MEPELAQLVADVREVKTIASAIKEDMTDLKTVHRDRLNNHANRINSLEETRDRQKGAAKILAILTALGTSVAALFHFGPPTPPDI